MKKMSWKELIDNMIKLILQSDGDEEHMAVPEVARWWYILFYSAIICMIFTLITVMIYPSGSDYEIIFTVVWRGLSLVMNSTFLLFFLILVLKTYEFLMIKGRSLILENVVVFYILGTFLFGNVYASIYIINQKLFTYINPPVHLTNILQSGFKVKLLQLDFVIYSFLISLNSNYYKISANNNFISFINILQLLFTGFIFIVLVSLIMQKYNFVIKNK